MTNTMSDTETLFSDLDDWLGTAVDILEGMRTEEGITEANAEMMESAFELVNQSHWAVLDATAEV